MNELNWIAWSPRKNLGKECVPVRKGSTLRQKKKKRQKINKIKISLMQQWVLYGAPEGTWRKKTKYFWEIHLGQCTSGSVRLTYTNCTTYSLQSSHTYVQTVPPAKHWSNAHIFEVNIKKVLWTSPTGVRAQLLWFPCGRYRKSTFFPLLLNHALVPVSNELHDKFKHVNNGVIAEDYAVLWLLVPFTSSL